jgi:hypothetical protein
MSPYNTAVVKTALKKKEIHWARARTCVRVCVCVCHAHIIHYDQHVGGFAKKDQLLH